MAVITKILTWLVYLLLIALIIAAIALVFDFIMWVLDVDYKVWLT